jgi:hypothetical protein
VYEQTGLLDFYLGLHQFSTGSIIPVITDIRYCPWCGEEIEVVRVK